MKRTRKMGRPSKIPNKDLFEKMYYDETLTVEEIARTFGVKKQTVYNWAFKYRNESEISDSNKDLSDKQILNCPTTINYNKKKERSKIS